MHGHLILSLFIECKWNIMPKAGIEEEDRYNYHNLCDARALPIYDMF